MNDLGLIVATSVAAAAVLAPAAIHAAMRARKATGPHSKSLSLKSVSLVCSTCGWESADFLLRDLSEALAAAEEHAATHRGRGGDR